MDIYRYNQLYADGEEDNEELVNQVGLGWWAICCIILYLYVTTYITWCLVQATIKDREWDAWKEENPRGSGNKMGKKYWYWATQRATHIIAI